MKREMKTAPALLLSSIGVFALMIALMNRTEAASITLFPIGALLALASLIAAVAGAVRGRGTARATSVATLVGSLFVVFLAAMALLWFLWVVMGVFGNAWG